MEQAAASHGVLFEAFKAVANVLATPWLSFSLTTIGLLLLLRFRRYVFNWWIGILAIAIEGGVIIWGMKDPNFMLIVGKPDNVPITAMLFISTFVLWLAMVQAVNNDRRVEQKLPPDEKERLFANLAGAMAGDVHGCTKLLVNGSSAHSAMSR